MMPPLSNRKEKLVNSFDGGGMNSSCAFPSLHEKSKIKLVAKIRICCNNNFVARFNNNKVLTKHSISKR
jgi:hypothetical protein